MSESYLIIIYSYKPLISPHAFRWTTLAEYLSSQGNRVDVLSALKPGLPKEEISNGVNIHRVGGGLIEILRQNYNNKIDDKRNNNNTKLIHNQKSIIKLIHDYTWKKIYWPDYACLWYFSGRKKALQLFEDKKYDKIITVSIPFTDHLVGLSIKKKYPKVIWVVDLGDPFSFLTDTPVNNYKLYNNLNFKIEKNVFNSANAVTVTPESFNKYKELFPENVKKMYIIPPLLTIGAKRYKNKDMFFLRDNKIRFVFVGTLYKHKRNPKFILNLFKKLLDTGIHDKLELHFFGNINDCQYCFKPYIKLLNKKIFLYGIVEKTKAYQAINEADILINIGNNTPYQLPSKVVEYASTGKPILNIVKKETDNSINFFDNYPIILNIIEESNKTIDEQSQEIKGFLQILPRQIDANKLKQFIEPFEVKNVAGTYSKIN